MASAKLSAALFIVWAIVLALNSLDALFFAAGGLVAAFLVTAALGALRG